MGGHMQNFPKLVYPAESSDEKYVSEVSTLLVANLQETKDRISEMEYMFCRQLYPKFRANTKSHQQIYSEAREAAESAFREQEKDLLLQIKTLQRQNQQVLEDNKLLKLEIAQFANMKNESCNRLKELQEELNQKTLEANERREVQENLQKLLESKSSSLDSCEKTKEKLEEENKMLLKMQKKLELDTEGLREELMKKSKEIDDMMELQNKLLNANQLNSSLVLKKENQWEEREEETNELITKLKKMECRVDELLSELREKTGEVERGKELHGNLLRKIEFQAAEIIDREQLLNKYVEEKRLLASRETSLSIRADELQKELGKRNSELEEVRNVRDQLRLQCDSSNIEIVKREQALEELREKKKWLLDKYRSLGEKWSDLNVSYKSLKSQHQYLLDKCNLTEENMLHLHLDGKYGETRHNQTPRPTHDDPKHTTKASDLTRGITRPEDEQEVLENNREALVVQRSNSASPVTSGILIAPKCPSTSRPCPSAGTKRPHSYWRDTRSHQSRVGPDPHDDFLDTPLEKVRDNLGKAINEVAAINMRLDDSDDQTQDISADCKQSKQQKLPTTAGTSGFKYVEPVRKKSERENLKGVECKQCKKFYDAVLPGEGDADKKNMRCEHQDGVSRHRYRYAPPSTPEGFWNIGFESEM